MKIVIANDHAAVDMKMEIMTYLQELGHEVLNIGTDTADRCNYPEYGEKAARHDSYPISSYYSDALLRLWHQILSMDEV